MATQSITLKKETDKSLLRELLGDGETLYNGETGSTYSVMLLENKKLGGKYALKLFKSGFG